MNICTPDACLGCGVCSIMCPHKAIMMAEDEEGFLRPLVESSRCVLCGYCRQVCPVVSTHVPLRHSKQICFGGAATSKNEVLSSTSGGVASVLSRNILGIGGVVVGAAFHPFPRVSHIVVDSEADLWRLKGSKYVESDIREVLPKVRSLLAQECKVLFVGLPCHVAALYAFLGGDNENLVTVDLVCHGKPPQKLFTQWVALLERLVGSKIVGYKFRNKDGCKWNSPQTHNHCYELVDGRVGVVPKEFNWYGRYFLGGASFRQCCYHCQFARLPRVGDLTLADFWGGEKDSRYMRFADQGLSLVTIQSEKGRKLLQFVDGLDVVECEPSFAIACNCGLVKCTKSQIYRRIVYRYAYWREPFRSWLDMIVVFGARIARKIIKKR